MKALIFALVLALQEDTLPTVANTMERLKLSPEQAAKAEPVLTEQVKQLKALREKIGDVKSASMRTKLNMRKQAQAIDAKADEQLKTILTAEQMQALLELRKQRRSKL